MTLTATLSADIRARASFLAYCPNCSHLGVTDFPDTLKGPSHRHKPLKPSLHYPKGRILRKLVKCCSLSDTDQEFDGEADAAAWWRSKRQQPLVCAADEARRVRCLERLAAAGMEPIL